MKTEFAWYIESLNPDLDKIWSSATLTLDANVLLDLYRHHSATRESILAAILSFGNRVWVSHQAASEFFKNRKTVISSAKLEFQRSRKAFEKAKLATSALRDELKANRGLSAEMPERVFGAVNEVLMKYLASIDEAEGEYPDFVKSDTLLSEIVRAFEGKVGNPFPENVHKSVLETAEKRMKAEQPPGYKDSGKKGTEQFGDYVLWAQIMDFAKSSPQPLILVTSERKEDWWERLSGATAGPRMELLKEFYETTGKHVLILRTEHFIRMWSERNDDVVDEGVVNDIISLAGDDQRLSDNSRRELALSILRSNRRLALLEEDDRLRSIIEMHAAYFRGSIFMINKSPMPPFGPAREARLRDEAAAGERRKIEFEARSIESANADARRAAIAAEINDMQFAEDEIAAVMASIKH